MENRFRFRAYNEKTGIMFDVGGVTYYKGDNDRHGPPIKLRVSDNINYRNTEKEVDVSLCTFGIYASKMMQCTGIVDKNGKLIYEDDICEATDGSIFEVVWHDGGFVGKLANSEHLKIQRGYSVVIGNIHENSNLIQKK